MVFYADQASIAIAIARFVWDPGWGPWGEALHEDTVFEKSRNRKSYM